MIDNRFDLAEQRDIVQRLIAMENYGLMEDEEKYATNHSMEYAMVRNLKMHIILRDY